MIADAAGEESMFWDVGMVNRKPFTKRCESRVKTIFAGICRVNHYIPLHFVTFLMHCITFHYIRIISLGLFE